MNLKHFYYRGYFAGAELAQPKRKTDARVALDKKNEAYFKKQNEHLLAATPTLSTELTLGNSISLRLAVQNPGLLPGVGYPHEVGYAGEFKLGFHFDHTSGLPVLPGSSVKGALRSVFPQYNYAEDEPAIFKPAGKAEKTELQKAKASFIVELFKDIAAANRLELPAAVNLPEGIPAFAHMLELALFEGWDFPEQGKPTRRPMSKHATCFDAFPTKFAETKKQPRLLGRDALTPHGDKPLKDPIPLPFLKILPGVVFTFLFRLPEFTVQRFKMTQAIQFSLFEAILERVGMGAKTNVGYGRLRDPHKPEQQPVALAAVPARQTDSPSGSKILSAAQASSPVDKPLPFNKSLQGKVILGEVVRVAAGEAWFRVVNVMGYDGEVSIKNPSASRFEVGKRYELRVSEANPNKEILKVQIHSLNPL